MPVSDYHQIPDVLSIIEQTNPKKVLDVGIGFGKWGILCREVLEATHGRLRPDEWTVQVDGVEIFEEYRNPLWELSYNSVFMGDILDIVGGLGTYDVIVACDVIEHFDKSEGKMFLNKMMDHARIVVITSPRGHYPQDDMWGNEFERHRSEWSSKDFLSIPHRYKEIGTTFMVVCSHDQDYLAQLNIAHQLDVFGAKRGAVELAKLWQRQIKRRVRR